MKLTDRPGIARGWCIAACLDGSVSCENKLQQERRCAVFLECVLIQCIVGRHAAHCARSFLAGAHILAHALQRDVPVNLGVSAQISCSGLYKA